MKDEPTKDVFTQVSYKQLQDTVDTLLFKNIPLGKELEYFSEVKSYLDVVSIEIRTLSKKLVGLQDKVELRKRDNTLDSMEFIDRIQLSQEKEYLEERLKVLLLVFNRASVQAMLKVIEYFKVHQHMETEGFEELVIEPEKIMHLKNATKQAMQVLASKGLKVAGDYRRVTEEQKIGRLEVPTSSKEVEAQKIVPSEDEKTSEIKPEWLQ